MKNLRVMLLLLGLSLPGWSETIIDTFLGPGVYSVSNTQSLAISWSVSSNFQNVTVAAPILAVHQDSFQTGTAYLASSGPSAPILSTQFSFPITPSAGANFAPAYVGLFYNLTLSPGTYYLTLMSTSQNTLGGWAMTTFPLVAQTASGVIVGETYAGNPADGPYFGQQVSPSGFRDVSALARAGLRVFGDSADDLTGDPVITAAPEPPAYALILGVALIGVAALPWKKSFV